MSVHLLKGPGGMACCGRSYGEIRELEGRNSALWTIDVERCTCPGYRRPGSSSSTAHDYHLLLLRNYAWPALTKRQRRKLWKLDPLLYAAVRGLTRTAERRSVSDLSNTVSNHG